MAYDRDLRRFQDICEAQKTFIKWDRQRAYEMIYDALVKAGLGVTMVGDHLTVRGYIDNNRNQSFQAHFILDEVKLERDWKEDEREQNEPSQ